MTPDSPARALVERIEKRALVLGGAGLALCLAGAFANREQFFRSYLMAFLFWSGLPLGSLALLMLQHLTGGSWGFVIRRLLEAGTRTLPLMAVLTAPLWFGLPALYLWAQPERVHADKILEHKARYLNVPFFAGRTVFYFAVWLLLAYFLNRWSAEQDRAGAAGAELAGRMESLSGPGLVFYGLTVTFSSTDWAMSLEPHWFSTVYGLQFMMGQVLAALAFSIVMARLLRDHEPMSRVLAPSHFHDLGNLMLAFVMLWAYLSFSQYLIIWSGNLPEEIPWYLHRTGAGWQGIALALAGFHFAVPFLLLLSREVKRKAERVATLALLLLAMRLVDIFWTIKPAFEPEAMRLHWLDVCWVGGMGGLWLWYFCRELKRQPLLPVGESA